MDLGSLLQVLCFSCDYSAGWDKERISQQESRVHGAGTEGSYGGAAGAVASG